jgi:hypothetical protein
MMKGLDMITQEDITIWPTRAGYEVSTMVDNYRVAVLYVDYSLDEAVSKFLEKVNDD